MKFVIIIFFIQYAFLMERYRVNGDFDFDPEVKAKYRKLHDTCVAESGVEESVIAQARIGDFEPDPKFKSFLHCCFEHEGALHADGTLNLNTLLSSLHHVLIERYEKSIRECYKEVMHDGDPLDYIYNYCYCIYEKTHDDFDIP